MKFSIGQKIRQFREERGLSRQDVCGDESVLSIRQLGRIEKDIGNPTISTLVSIATALNLPLYQLMYDYKELPARYKELRYLLLRQASYGSRALLEQQEIYLDEIFADYYSELDEEEQSVVDYLQATVQLLLTDEVAYADELIAESIENLWATGYLSLIDLVFLRLLTLYFFLSIMKDKKLSPKYLLIFDTSFTKLLEQVDFFAPEELYVYVNCIFSGLNYYELTGNYSLYPKSITVLRQVLTKTQDFQKKPLLYLLEWKWELFQNRDEQGATIKYQKSLQLASFWNDDHLLEGLKAEWQEDLEKFHLSD